MKVLTPKTREGFRKLLAWVTAAGLIFANLTGFGSLALPAHASDASPPPWEFTDTAQFTLSSNSDFTFAVDPADAADNVAALNLNWTASGDADISSKVLDLLETGTADRILAVVLGLTDQILVSTDGGSAWSLVTVDAGPSTNSFFDLARNPGSGRIVLVGQQAVLDQAVSFYSTDQGANWSGPFLFSAASTIAWTVSWDSANSQFWAGTDEAGGQPLYTSPDGETWTVVPGSLTNATVIHEILPVSASVLYAGGYSSSLGDVLWYTTDGGANWSLTDNLGADADRVTSLALGSVAGRFQGRLFVGTNAGKIFRSSGDALGGWDAGLDWQAIPITDLTKVETFYLDSQDNLFLAGDSATAGTLVYWSLDGGNNWTPNNPSGLGLLTTDVINNALIRLASGLYLLSSYKGGGGGDIHRGSFYASASSYNPTIKSNKGFQYSQINSLTVSYASSSELDATNTQVKFKLTSTGGATWHYWDGGAWATTDENTASQSSTTAEIQTNIGSFPGSGSQFGFKVFFNTSGAQPTSNSVVHLDSIALDYSGSSGGGGDGRRRDNNPPVSRIYEINGKTDANDQNPGNGIVEAGYITQNPFTVKALAQDASAIVMVNLYHRFNQKSSWLLYGTMEFEGFSPQGEIWQIGFDINQAQGEGFYEFYSRATDGVIPPNIEKDKKQAEGNGTVDLYGPYLVFTSPYDGEIEVGTKEPIILTFSEAINPATLKLKLIKTEPAGGSWSWWPLGWTQSWRGNTQVTLNHIFEFSRATTYTLEAEAQDVAGRNLDNSRGKPNPWSFTVVPPQDPDLSNSRKDVSVFDQQGQERQTARPGDTLVYSLFIINDRGDNRDLRQDKNSKITVKDVLPPDVDPASLFFYGNPARGEIVITPDGFIWEIPFIKEKESLPPLVFEVKLKSVIQNNPVINRVEISYWTYQFPEKKITVILTPVPVELDIDLSSSTFTALPAFADPGETVVFTLLLQNTGKTLADNLWAVNPIPSDTSLNDKGDFNFDAKENKLTWSGQLLAGATKILSFSLKINGDQNLRGKTITDVISLTNYAPDGQTNYALSLSAMVKIKPFFDVDSTDPQDGAQNVPLYKTLKIIFTHNLKADQKAEYELTSQQLGANQPTFELKIDGKTLSFEHLNDPFSQGATYTLTLIAVYDEQGNVLSDFSFSFTTAAPQFTITDPADQTIRIAKDTPQLFKVALKDAISGQSYATEKETTVRLFSTSETARFAEKEEGPYEARQEGEWWIKDLTLAAGVSNFNFYYQDSVSTPPPQEENAHWVGVTNPGEDWYAAERKVIVEGEMLITGEFSLVLTGPYLVTQNRFSEAYTLIKRNQQGERAALAPNEKLYLATNSPTGAFYRYPLDEAKLPYLLSVQAIDDSRIQVLTSNGGESESFFFKDASIGTHLLYVSLDATIDQSDALAIVTVMSAELEEELLEELEEIEDESGRILAQIELVPESAQTLPFGLIRFKATAYGSEDEIIESAKFAWFIVNGGGAIMPSGLLDDSSVSLFTANDERGEFRNTVLVATLYNDKLGTAQASVKILGLGEFFPPGTLPSTGPNGLQLTLMGITLLAAIALAWVEHYEKTYLAKSQ